MIRQHSTYTTRKTALHGILTSKIDGRGADLLRTPNCVTCGISTPGYPRYRLMAARLQYYSGMDNRAKSMYAYGTPSIYSRSLFSSAKIYLECSSPQDDTEVYGRLGLRRLCTLSTSSTDDISTSTDDATVLHCTVRPRSCAIREWAHIALLTQLHRECNAAARQRRRRDNMCDP